MNSFGSYYHQSAPQVPYYYQVNDHYYHQYQTYPTPQDLAQSSYQVYNYDPYSYVPATSVQQGTTQSDATAQTATKVQVQTSAVPVNHADQQYHVYKPAPGQISSTVETVITKEPDDLVSILKKNPEVWQAYQSGNFKVKEIFEDGNRRIILKEKGKKGEDYEYTVKKYKVGLHHSKHHLVKEDEKNLLLVSFSSSSINKQPLVAKTGASSAVAAIPEQQLVQYQQNQEPQQVSIYRPVSQAQIVQQNLSHSGQSHYVSQPPIYTQAPVVYQDNNSLALRTMTANSFYPQTTIIAQPANYGAPGDDFIQKLINGEDEDIEYLVPEVHELVGNFLIYPKPKAQTPKKLERDNSLFEDSYDHDYIRKYAPSKKSHNESRSSVGSRSVSQSRSTLASRNESRNSNALSDDYSSSKILTKGNAESPFPSNSREENNNSRLSALNYSPTVPESDDNRSEIRVEKRSYREKRQVH